MKRTLAVLSFVLVLAATAFAQTTQAQKAEKLSKQQLLSLIATAKTPVEHSRLAAYYTAEAQDYLAQSSEHGQMAAEYKKNPTINSSKFATATVNHCEYLAQHFKENAMKMQELAHEHELMADEAGKK
jgi:Tfp pilus assembly protein FimT